MNSSIVIFGAGDHGRGTYEILLARAAAGLETAEVLGFVDDSAARQGTRLAGLPVLGGIGWLLERASEQIETILAIASPEAKRTLAVHLSEAGVGFAQAIHPSAILGTGVQVGPGAIIGAGVVIAYDTRVGVHTTINLGATVGHDCVIGDFATVAPGVNITGHVEIGEGAQVQTNATVVPGVKIGAWARVGPGSVVLREVGSSEFVFGNPARRMQDPGTKP